MNICEPEVVFLTVASDNMGAASEATFNKSDKMLQRALMASGAKFEATWTSHGPLKAYGFRKWLAVNCGTMNVWRAISNACMNDPNVSMCSKAEFLAGGKQSREEVPNG